MFSLSSHKNVTLNWSQQVQSCVTLQEVLLCWETHVAESQRHPVIHRWAEREMKTKQHD